MESNSKNSRKVVSNSAILSAAGEYYVLFELTRRGMIASLAPRNAPHIDIIVSDQHAKMSFVVQVKTTKNANQNYRGWMFKAKHERLQEGQLFYFLVDLEPDQQTTPEVYIVPSKEIAAVLQLSHQTWLKTPGRRGQVHKDTKMRRVRPHYPDLDLVAYPKGWMECYKDGWNGLPSGSVNHPV